MVQVKSKKSLLVSVVMMTLGIAVIYYSSSGFSGTADFQSGVGPIVSGNLMPFFAVGIVVFALGMVQLLGSLSSL